MLSPNVLLHCPQPVIRRQVEAALWHDMPNANLYEATDLEAAENLAEEHDLDIVLLSLCDDGYPELENLAALRRLQPDARMILLSLRTLPSHWVQALDQLDISPVSLRHLAPTLLRPVSEVHSFAGALANRQWTGRGAPPMP